ncbi:unnamed protein product [Rotaria sordida]|uniref:G-protein coupled receptors family 1 profile domain-containing protein n=1 Tax=Rotaria sordida TaxID=392033 RepID=A0A814AF15_9BILA|nr:unnamed protein product [Rotaria sordida]CAF3571231.1 unnamed protein product [Rotaria sordida]
MSLKNNLIIIFPYIIKILSRYLLPFILLFGNISCLLSLIVFFQKSMRKNPSDLYFLSSTLCNIIFINTIITSTILYFGFNIDPSGNILIICQIQFYIGFITTILSSTFLVLASIDRYIISSINYNNHRFSTHSMAIKFIFSITIFWCIIHIHSFFFIIKSKDNNEIFYCTLKNGVYTFIIIFYEFIIHDLLTPALMILFSLRTIINVRHVMINPISRLHSVDRQLIIIMLSQCFIYLSFRLPLLIYFIFNYIIKYSKKNIYYWTNNIIIFYLSLLCFFIPYCTFFFINLMSYSFRVEFKRLTKTLIRRYFKKIRKSKKHRHNQVYPMETIQRRARLEMTLQ